MAEKTYELTFDGYWRDENKGGIPEQSGVYCVYECSFDANAQTVSLKTLIYIGEAGNANERVKYHEKYDNWKTHVRKGNQLCFSFAPVHQASRVRCEAAMIFEHKPPENSEYVDAFPFDKTTINLLGKTALLSRGFVVETT